MLNILHLQVICKKETDIVNQNIVYMTCISSSLYVYYSKKMLQTQISVTISPLLTHLSLIVQMCLIKENQKDTD